MNKSVFDLDHQNSSIESKIVASLERVSEAFRVLLWNESKHFSLSPIQVQVLIFLLNHSSQKRKVSYIADEFNMTKATVSDTIKTLQQKLLISKQPEQNDTRSFVINLTDKGKNLALQTSLFATQLQVPINKLNDQDKVNLLLSLLDIIRHLNRTGIITIQRMCFSCQYYESDKNGQGHYCKLLQTKLADSELRIDCPEYSHSSPNF